MEKEGKEAHREEGYGKNVKSSSPPNADNKSSVTPQRVPSFEDLLLPQDSLSVVMDDWGELLAAQQKKLKEEKSRLRSAKGRTLAPPKKGSVHGRCGTGLLALR